MDASALLEASGWRPGRSVDISQDLAALAAEGYDVSSEVAAVLREFSRLTISMPGKSNPLLIDGVVGARHADPRWELAYSEALGFRLVPVGEYSNLLFWVAPDGDIWATYDDTFGRAGASLPEMVQGLFFEPDGWQLDRRIDPD